MTGNDIILCKVPSSGRVAAKTVSSHWPSFRSFRSPQCIVIRGYLNRHCVCYLSCICQLRHVRIFKGACRYEINARCAAFADVNNGAGLPGTSRQIHQVNAVELTQTLFYIALSGLSTMLVVYSHHGLLMAPTSILTIVGSGELLRSFKPGFPYYRSFFGGGFRNRHGMYILVDECMAVVNRAYD